MIRLTSIVAMTPERVIGKNGGLPWHLPEDLAFFKRTTLGHPVVMGRKTYASIGRPLPRRRNIVVTRDREWSAEGVEAVHAPQELASLPGLDGQVFLIGGAELYAALLPETEELLISHVFERYPGDTRFPEYEREFPVSEVVARFAEFEVRRWRRSIGS